MKTRLTQKSVRKGMTYLSVVIAAVLVGLTLATYLKLVASQNQMTMRSQAWNRNIAVVEAGIEEAMAHLNKNGVWDIRTGTYTGNLLVDGWSSTAGGGYTKTSWIGEDYYIVTIGAYTAGTNCPTVVAEGYVKQLPTFTMTRRLMQPFMADVTGNGSTYVKRTVVCATTNIPVFTKALVAKKTIDLNGNNMFTDSYDSSNPLYSSNSVYTTSKRRDHGDIATNKPLRTAWISETPTSGAALPPVRMRPTRDTPA